MVVIGAMSHLHADGHPAYVRLMTHRRRAAGVAAGLVAAFVPLDLAQEVGSSAAVVLRILWVALLLAAIAAQRPDSPRLSAAAARLICFLSGVILVAIVAVTGGADGIYFHFLLALPLGAMVVAPDLPSGAALTALVTTSGGAALLLRDGHPALHVLSWVLMSVAAGTLSLWGTILYARSWAAEVASERARARAAEELARSERRRAAAERLATVGRLAAGIAHELNNPLTGVLSYASLLRKRLDGDKESCDDLDVIVRETVRCRGIIRGLLDFARPTPPARKPMDLNEVVRRAVSVVMTQLSLNQVDLSLDLAPQLPVVHADANQIQQVAVNLLLNAGDAINGDGGTIRLTTRAGAEGSVEMLVQDNGRGIPAEDLPRIFEPFYTTKGSHGTGLGLAVSWGIVEAHGGTLEVHSDPGQGACFTLRIPASAGSGEGTGPLPIPTTT
jgi:signal transduction histidine kinase